MARPVVGSAIAERNRYAEISLQIAAEEEPHAAAGRGQCDAVAGTKTIIPGKPAVDETIELIAGQVFVAKLLVETQLQRARDAVVTADLGRAVAAPESGSAE